MSEAKMWVQFSGVGLRESGTNGPVTCWLLVTFSNPLRAGIGRQIPGILRRAGRFLSPKFSQVKFEALLVEGQGCEDPAVRAELIKCRSAQLVAIAANDGAGYEVIRTTLAVHQPGNILKVVPVAREELAAA